MRSARLRPASRLLGVAGVLPVLVLGGPVVPPPAAAAVREVHLTRAGPVPTPLQLAVGDTLTFVNDDTFVHRVVSDGGPWERELDSGQILPGASYPVKEPLARPGTYSYRGVDLDSFVGSAVVPDPASTAPAPAAPASPQATAAAGATAPPSAAQPSAAQPTAAASTGGTAVPSPTSTGGAGTAVPPALAGSSLDGVDGLATTPSPGVPAPQLAPGVQLPGVAPAVPYQTLDPQAPLMAEELPGTVPGPLPQLSSPVEARRYGLPLALAVVLLAGVVSLLVRVLLAEAPGPTVVRA